MLKVYNFLLNNLQNQFKILTYRFVLCFFGTLFHSISRNFAHNQVPSFIITFVIFLVKPTENMHDKKRIF